MTDVFSTNGHTDHADPVEVSVPATMPSLPVLRSVAATVALNADFDTERIDDVRLLSDEIATLLIRQRPRAHLRCRIGLEAAGFRMRLSTIVGRNDRLDREGLGWRVVNALADTVRGWTTACAPDARAAVLNIEATVAA